VVVEVDFYTKEIAENAFKTSSEWRKVLYK